MKINDTKESTLKSNVENVEIRLNNLTRKIETIEKYNETVDRNIFSYVFENDRKAELTNHTNHTNDTLDISISNIPQLDGYAIFLFKCDQCDFMSTSKMK